MESQASEGEVALFLNLELSRAYSGCWLQEAVPARRAGVLADGLLACGFLEACVGDDVCILVFIYVSLLFSSSRGTQMLW